MGRAKNCCAEKRHLIIKLKQEGKTCIYLHFSFIHGCSPMMIRNSLKWKNVAETRDRK